MSLTDDVLKLAGIATAGWTLYSLIRKAPAEARTLAVSNRASELGGESQLLDAYSKVVERMAAQDDRIAAQDDQMALMRSQLNQATGTIEKQAAEIAQLARAAVRHGNDIEQANKDAAEYKKKWNECLTSCQQQASEIRILRAILIKNGLLTSEVETAIKAELDAPPKADDLPPGERETE